MELEQWVPDLRFGGAPLPATEPGIDPVADATAVAPAGPPPRAPAPVPGRQVRGLLTGGGRFVLRLPDRWNRRLILCGTPALRSEFASDLIFAECLLARGYAVAAANKRIPANAVIVAPSEATERCFAIDMPATPAHLRGPRVRLGALEPRIVRIGEWTDDFVELAVRGRELVVALAGDWPERVYAVGLSNGGAQVRSLLERRPDLVDGGLDWAGVYWSPETNLLTYLPPFLRAMDRYTGSGFSDASAHAEIVALGYPPDRRRDDPAHPSLWADYDTNLPPFYSDITTFVYSALVEPDPPAVADRRARANYRLSPAGREAIAAFAHSGAIGRPLVSIVAEADTLITPSANARPYLDAVVAAGAAERYWQFVVADGGHVDNYCAYGYGLVPMFPFAHAAFETLVGIVERGVRPAGAGTARAVARPDEIG